MQSRWSWEIGGSIFLITEGVSIKSLYILGMKRYLASLSRSGTSWSQKRYICTVISAPALSQWTWPLPIEQGWAQQNITNGLIVPLRRSCAQVNGSTHILRKELLAILAAVLGREPSKSEFDVFFTCALLSPCAVRPARTSPSFMFHSWLGELWREEAWEAVCQHVDPAHVL